MSRERSDEHRRREETPSGYVVQGGFMIRQTIRRVGALR